MVVQLSKSILGEMEHLIAGIAQISDVYCIHVVTDGYYGSVYNHQPLIKQAVNVRCLTDPQHDSELKSTSSLLLLVHVIQ